MSRIHAVTPQQVRGDKFGRGGLMTYEQKAILVLLAEATGRAKSVREAYNILWRTANSAGLCSLHMMK